MLRIEVNELSIGRRSLAKLMNINVPKGEVHLLQGPNGCGKSLLLDVVTGIHRDSGVKVWLNDQDLNRRSAYSRWRSGIRRMFQQPTLPFELSVKYILERYGLNSGSSRMFWRNSAQLLKDCGVRPNEQFGIHSFGQQRLVELVIALASGQGCLLDEPFAGLNPAFVIPARELIRQEGVNKKAVLVIDHLSAHHRGLYDLAYEWRTQRETEVKSGPETAESLENYATPTEGSYAHARWSIADLSIDERPVMRDVEIHLAPGTMILLAGANGTGKSTLIRELGGYGQPWLGVSSKMCRSIPDEQIFLSPQPPKIVDELTAEENLWLMMGGGDRVERADRAIALDMLNLLSFPPSRLRERGEVLSGGEASIIALVGAILSPPNIIFLDEPFESLSPDTIAKAVQFLGRAMGTGKAVLASSHNAQFIAHMDPAQVIDLTTGKVLSGHWAGKPLMKFSLKE
jgi:ABC-type multidrug transport system ATPase subunit